MERQLLALPVREGGLNIIDPTKSAESHFNAYTAISAPIIALLIQQTPNYTSTEKDEQQKIVLDVKRHNRKVQHDEAEPVYKDLPKELQKAVDLAREKDSSSWLTALPIAKHGFALHKGAFRDAISSRCG